MLLWPCDCLQVNGGVGARNISLSHSSSAWRSVKMALMAARECSCTSTACNHHTQSRPKTLRRVMRYRGRVRTFSGLRGVGGVRAGGQRQSSGVSSRTRSQVKARTTAVAIAEEQQVQAESIGGGLTVRASIKPSRVCLRSAMMQPSSSLRERAPAQHTKILIFCTAAHAPHHTNTRYTAAT
jgi:hypothetical protein